MGLVLRRELREDAAKPTDRNALRQGPITPRDRYRRKAPRPILLPIRFPTLHRTTIFLRVELAFHVAQQVAVVV